MTTLDELSTEQLHLALDATDQWWVNVSDNQHT
jgi:hypothetical protein